jgi:hypothetical protein
MEAEVIRLKVSEVYMVNFIRFCPIGLLKTDPRYAGNFGRLKMGHA